MAKTDKKKQKQRRKSESEELSSDSSAESIDKKPNKRRKTERITSSSDSDDEDNKTPSKMNRNMAKTDKKKQKQRRKSESEEYMSDSSAESIDKKPKKGRKTERVSSSSDSDNEDNKTPSKRNIDRAKTDKRKQKQGRKSESEERKSGPSEESIDTKPNKRRKESVPTSSDSDDEDNRTPKKKKNTSRKTAPPGDSDSETPQPSQKMAAHKTPSKSPDLLQTFKNTNELNDVSTKARPLLSDLSDSDIFFVQIPKSLHPQLLTDTLVSLDEKAKLRVGKTSYVWDTSGPDRIPLNVMELRKKGKGVIKRLNCPRIIVREQFKLKQFPLELGQQPDEPVPYPADLKSRHPLFGSEYVERIKLDEGVKRKLSSAREKRVKEKRRKRDLKNESDVYEEMFLSQNELGGVTGERNQLNFEVKRKKKRKRELDQ